MFFACVAPARVHLEGEKREREVHTAGNIHMYIYIHIYIQSSFLKPVLGERSYFYMTRAGSPRRVTSSIGHMNALSSRDDFLRLRLSGAPSRPFAKRSSGKLR